MPSPVISMPLAPTLAPLGDQPRRAFERLARAGYRFVQLSATQPGLRPRDLDQSGRRDLATTLRRRELAPSGLDLWIPVDHFLDPALIDRAVAAVIASIEFAAALGRCTVCLALPGVTDDDNAAEEVIRTVSEWAARLDVPLADHAIPPREQDGLRAGLDPAAWLGAGEDPAAGVTSLGQRLASVRLCDLLTSGMRGPVGRETDGRLDVVAYQVALSVSGYARPVVVDARQWADPWGGLEISRAAWDGAAPPPTR